MLQQGAAERGQGGTGEMLEGAEDKLPSLTTRPSATDVGKGEGSPASRPYLSSSLVHAPVGHPVLKARLAFQLPWKPLASSSNIMKVLLSYIVQLRTYISYKG